jgi:hypothetical protein
LLMEMKEGGGSGACRIGETRELAGLCRHACRNVATEKARRDGGLPIWVTVPHRSGCRLPLRRSRCAFWHPQCAARGAAAVLGTAPIWSEERGSDHPGGWLDSSRGLSPHTSALLDRPVRTVDLPTLWNLHKIRVDQRV